MRRIIFLLVWITGSCPALPAAASWPVNPYLGGTIEDYAHAPLFLLRFDNSSRFAYEVADSTFTDSLGRFRLRQPAGKGMYRLCQGREGWYASSPANTLHLWLGFGEEVALRMKMNDFTGSVQFTKGKYNSWWYANERALAPYLQKLGICMQLMDVYPAGSFYSEVLQEYLGVQREVQEAWRRLKKEQPDNPLLDAQRRLSFPLTGQRFKKEERTAYWRQHLLDSIDFSAPALQASHLLAQKLEQYLELFGYPYDFATAADMDKGLLVAVKGIMDHARNGYYSRHNRDVQTASLQFTGAWLYQFCSSSGLEQCMAYMADQMTADVFTSTCHVSPGTLQTLQRMQTSQRLKAGMAAPDISFGQSLPAREGMNGPPVPSGSRPLQKLNDIKAKRTLVVFWASWCAHCQEELPKLKQLYERSGHKDWEVVAVSIDTLQQAWQRAIGALPANWLHYCDGNGWESAPAKDYGVFSTPAMFWLDERKQLLARLAGVDELAQKLGAVQPVPGSAP